MEKQIFKKEDEVFIKDEKFKITEVGPTYCRVKNSNNNFYIDTNLISFTPYTLEGFTHERPTPKPAGMFWDNEVRFSHYGVLDEKCEISENEGYPYASLEMEESYKHFEEMTFDEYRKRKGI